MANITVNLNSEQFWHWRLEPATLFHPPLPGVGTVLLWFPSISGYEIDRGKCRPSFQCESLSRSLSVQSINSDSNSLSNTVSQDRREGGVAGATAPGPGPRQGPVKIKLCFSIICFCDIIELGPARGPEESNFHLVRSTLH